MNNLPEELKKQIPDKPKVDVEEGVKRVDDKIHEMEDLMKEKVNQIDDLINTIQNKNKDDTMSTAIDNVREMLTEKPKDDNSK